jgi:hypothetical protein
VNGCRGPFELVGGTYQTSSNRIQLNIAQGIPEMIVVKQAGIVSVLPKVAACTLMLLIHVHGIPAVRASKRLRQSIESVRDHNPVDVIGH